MDTVCFLFFSVWFLFFAAAGASRDKHHHDLLRSTHIVAANDQLTKTGLGHNGCSYEDVLEFASKFQLSTIISETKHKSHVAQGSALSTPKNHSQWANNIKSAHNFVINDGSLQDLSFTHPNSELIVLYLFPARDDPRSKVWHLSDSMCGRLLAFTKLASVRVRYVSSNRQAVLELQAVRNSGKKLVHLVMGGHGNRLQLAWNTCTQRTHPCMKSYLQPGEPTEELMQEVRAQAPQSLLLDSCSTGAKNARGTDTLCKWIASQVLASSWRPHGVSHVFCSSKKYSVSFDLDIQSFKPFHAEIHSVDGRKGTVHYTNIHRLRMGDRVRAYSWSFEAPDVGNRLYKLSHNQRSSASKNAVVRDIHSDGSVKLEFAKGKVQTVPVGFVTSPWSSEGFAEPTSRYRGVNVGYWQQSPG